MTEHKVFISLGSNQGDRLANLRAAIQSMPPKVIPLACSSIYETIPWGYLDQPMFLNQVIRARTGLEPLGLLAFLKQIEVEIGRQPTFRYGPRSIDLDILLYEDIQLDLPALQIPHPQMEQRVFVLLPLAELNPDMRLPDSDATVSQRLAELEDNGVEYYAPGDCGSEALNHSGG